RLWQLRINENGVVIQWSICQILGDFGPSGSGISVSCFRFDLLAAKCCDRVVFANGRSCLVQKLRPRVGDLAMYDVRNKLWLSPYASSCFPAPVAPSANGRLV